MCQQDGEVEGTRPAVALERRRQLDDEMIVEIRGKEHRRSDEGSDHRIAMGVDLFLRDEAAPRDQQDGAGAVECRVECRIKGRFDCHLVDYAAGFVLLRFATTYATTNTAIEKIASMPMEVESAKSSLETICGNRTARNDSTP